LRLFRPRPVPGSSQYLELASGGGKATRVETVPICPY
jgi:hypothetical protein